MILSSILRSEHLFSAKKTTTVLVCGRTAKHAVSPGMMSWMCPDTAFSLTPDSIQIWPSSLQAWDKHDEINIISRSNMHTVYNSSVFLWQWYTYCIDGHSGLKVVHTAQDQIHRLPFFKPSMTDKTQNNLLWRAVPQRRENSKTRNWGVGRPTWCAP